jgi:hypothetical protein
VGGPRVLLVEDPATMCSCVVVALEAMGDMSRLELIRFDPGSSALARLPRIDVSKPFAPEVLAAAVHRHLGARR